jgi:Mor family transcriptional regulator
MNVKGGIIDWIKDVEFEDLLEKDMRIVFDSCQFETFCDLMENMSGLGIYVSKKSLFDIQRRYIQKYFDRHDEKRSAKALAAKLRVSEKFVYNAIATTDEKDVRQEKLL